MVNKLITYVLTHFGLIGPLVGILIGYWEGKNTQRLWTSLLKWTLLLGAGVVGLYAFLVHGFFGNFTAQQIGWANSPFQYEVAIANLAVGVLGVMAFSRPRPFRLAAVVVVSVWLWGDAVGHMYQMAVSHNFAPGNAGAWFLTDIVVPLLLWWFYMKSEREPA